MLHGETPRWDSAPSILPATAPHTLETPACRTAPTPPTHHALSVLHSFSTNLQLKPSQSFTVLLQVGSKLFNQTQIQLFLN